MFHCNWSHSYPQLVLSCGEIRRAVNSRRPPKNVLAASSPQYSWEGPDSELRCSHNKWSSRWWCEFWEEDSKEWFPMRGKDVGWLDRGRRRLAPNIFTEWNKTFPWSSIPANSPALRSFRLSVPTTPGLFSGMRNKMLKKERGKGCGATSNGLVNRAFDQRWFKTSSAPLNLNICCEYRHALYRVQYS